MADFLLGKAVIEGELEKVRTLLIDGIDVNGEDQEGYTVLLYAAHNGHFEVASLLIEYRAAINHQNKNGNAALYIASVCNRISIVSLLIAKGADINIKSNFGYTPLMSSTIKGHPSVISLLLRNGADATMLDNDGQTALDYARRKKKSDCILILQNYEHFHRYRKALLSFATTLRSFQDNQNQSQRVMDSSDLVRYVTEFM